MHAYSLPCTSFHHSCVPSPHPYTPPLYRMHLLLTCAHPHFALSALLSNMRAPSSLCAPSPCRVRPLLCCACPSYRHVRLLVLLVCLTCLPRSRVCPPHSHTCPPRSRDCPHPADCNFCPSTLEFILPLSAPPNLMFVP
jgi:hypothetical protein